jgi:GntR family transcriptional regulator
MRYPLCCNEAEVDHVAPRTKNAKKKAANAPLRDLSRDLVPIYLQLITIFRRFIVSGQWPLNEQVPTLDELSAQFGVARATVRQAIGFLEQEGLVARYRRHGTFVIAKPQRESWYTIPTDWKGALAAHDALVAEWLECKRAGTPPKPYHPGAELASAYQILRRRYRHDGAPLLLETAHLDAVLYRAIGMERLRKTPTLKLLDTVSRAKIARVEQSIYVGASDGETSVALAIPLNAPIAVVRQTVCNRENGILYESEAFYRGDSVRVIERMKVGG